MSRIYSTAAALLTAMVFPSGVNSQQTAVLRDGTAILLRLKVAPGVASLKPGDAVELEAVDEIKVGDTLTIARGAEARATAIEPSAKKARNHTGRIDLKVEYIRLADGNKATLRAVPEVRMDAREAELTSASVPAAEGAELTAYVWGDVPIDRPAALAQPAPKAMTNEDILALRTAGVSDDLIVARIKNGPGAYKVGTEDIIALTQAGVSEPVIEAMVASEGQPALPAATAAALPPGVTVEPPRRSLLGKLKVAILGSPDAWSGKAAAHPTESQQPAASQQPTPPQYVLCPVTILSQPPDAVILVDGYPAGRTPAVVKLQAGTYKVTLQAPGFPSYTQQIIVEAGQVRSFGVALESAH